MSYSKRTLIDRYQIPIHHLDFGYIKTCNNDREMEKILHILYSGEQGFYEKLTKCAEERLKFLKPDSKLFRYESVILRRQALDKDEWEEHGEPVLEWSDEVKVKDNFLSIIANEKGPQLNIPDIRGKNKKICIISKEENRKSKNESEGNASTSKIDDNRKIQSTDYRAWDKYDADTECLKMELDEERIKEEYERNKLKEKKEMEKEMKVPLSIDEEIINKLTNVEKEALSLKHKDRGNDYFRIKEYQNALLEYTKCIEIYPMAVVYNNRAITYMKMSLYKKAIEDLDKCLEMDSKNIKALLRKAQSLIEMDKRRDAYSIYTKIISMEPSNVAARQGLNDLKKELGDLPPVTATRILIKEDEDDDNQSPVEINQDDNNVAEILQKEPEEILKENSEKNISEFVNAITDNEGNKTKNFSKGKSDTIEIKEKNDKDLRENFENMAIRNQVSKTYKNERLKSKYENMGSYDMSSSCGDVQNKSKNIEHEKVVSVNKSISQNSKSEIQCSQTRNEETNTVKVIKSKNSESKKSPTTTLKNDKIEPQNVQNISASATENKKSKKKSKRIEDDGYVQEDLSKLIIPKRIVKSKLAKTMEALTNNNIPLPIPKKNQLLQNKGENFKNSQMMNRSASPSQPKLNIKLLPDKPKTDFFIKEIR